MSVLIGHASKDERGRASGGKAGDQTGGEVCIRGWYNAKKLAKEVLAEMRGVRSNRRHLFLVSRNDAAEIQARVNEILKGD